MRLIFVLAIFAFAMTSGGANAQAIDMGNCTQNDSIAAETILVACKNFIIDRNFENCCVEYIVNATYYRGIAYQRLGRDKEAQADFRQLMHDARGLADAWVRYGQIAEKTGGPAQFEKVIDIMIATNQADPDVLNTACWERAKRGEQLASALADCNESLRLRPHDPNTTDSRALLYFRMGKYQAAIDDDTAALAGDPKLATALFVRGISKTKAGDTAGGAVDIAAAKAIDPKVEDMFTGYGVKL